MKSINRRDLLKLISATVPAVLFPRLITQRLLSSANDNHKRPNIILILFDAMSARNLSVYGYDRETTPNLKRFSERAIVYHSHFSGGNFTTPGTASIYTGVYPWKHRAINFWGLVNRRLVQRNIFELLGDEYAKMAYSQNYLSTSLLYQFQRAIDFFVPSSQYSFKPLQIILSDEFSKDANISHNAIQKFLFNKRELPGSLFLGYLDRFREEQDVLKKYFIDEYPYGLPDNTYYSYKNPDVYSGVFDEIRKMNNRQNPYFAFFHLFSPHNPYSPRIEFVDSLSEFKAPFKPPHRLSSNHFRKVEMDASRKRYDEYIAEVDFEVGILLDRLDAQGFLDNSYVILTADHGELFERGEIGHVTRLLFDPIIHIPLIILDPINNKRRDVYANTNSVDILPTILYLAGRTIPEELDGELLPELGGLPNFTRSIFSMDAKENSAFAPFKFATISLIKGSYKLIHYLGYPRILNDFELFNLEDDVEEKKDVYTKEPEVAKRMRDELLYNLEVADEEYK